MARHNEIRLTDRHQRWIYVVFAILYLSGVTWLIGRWSLPAETDPFHPRYAPQDSSVEFWSLRVHGGAAMLFLIVLGTLIPGHIRGGLLAKKNYASGLLMLVTNGVLILTGYALYYGGEEDLRLFSSFCHIGVGLAILPVLLWHVIRGRKGF